MQTDLLSDCRQPDDVREVARLLRARLISARGDDPAAYRVRVGQEFEIFARSWRTRLMSAWEPSADSLFPWTQVRQSLEALLPGFRAAGDWLQRAESEGKPAAEAGIVAIVAAGNTPLLVWPAIAAALLAGHAVFLKQSTDEPVWGGRFRKSLALVAPDIAGLIYEASWPGDDPRTAALMESCDAVVAYGGDAAIAALRRLMPPATPFFGFGHALSVGLVTGAAWATEETAAGFARDVLMYGQAGCLSPQTVFTDTAETARRLALVLPRQFAAAADALQAPAVTDPAVACAVRTARDMALFDGYQIIGDERLRWTVAWRETPTALPLPVGHGILTAVPLPGDPGGLSAAFGAARGRISSIGVAGALSETERAALTTQGVSRFCRPGEMQTPPLDWPNGNIDLLAELLHISGSSQGF